MSFLVAYLELRQLNRVSTPYFFQTNQICITSMYKRVAHHQQSSKVQPSNYIINCRSQQARWQIFWTLLSSSANELVLSPGDASSTNTLNWMFTNWLVACDSYWQNWMWPLCENFMFWRIEPECLNWTWTHYRIQLWGQIILKVFRTR